MVPSPSSSGVGWLAFWPAGWPVASSAVCPPAWCAGQLGVARLAGWLRLRFAGCPPRGCFNGMGVAGRRPWAPPTQGSRRGPCHPRARPSSLAIVGGGLAPRCPGQAPEALPYNTTQCPEPHCVITYNTMWFASLCCVIGAPVFWGELAL